MKIAIHEIQTITQTHELKINKADIPKHLKDGELKKFLYDFAYDHRSDWVFKKLQCIESQIVDVRLEEGKIEKEEPKTLTLHLSVEDIQNLISRLFMLTVIGELSINHMEDFERFLSEYLSFKEQLIAEGYSFEFKEKKEHQNDTSIH